VGSASDSRGSHGFIDRAGKFRTIVYPGATNTEGNAINDNGDVVGDFTDKGYPHGFLL
jgi:hypothetical protein